MLLPGLDAEAALSGGAAARWRMAYCVIGRAGEGGADVRGVAADEPGSSVCAGTRWRRARAQDVPLRAPDEYVQQIFDSFADSFEAKLARLQLSRAGARG